MRKNNIQQATSNGYKIIAVDDEMGIVDSLSIFLKRSGYDFTGVSDPMEAIERVKNEHFDLMILDFIMTPIHGDQVVEEIRKFNQDLYIILLTGHKDLAPPLETIKRLSIQGYCEKSDKFDQLLLLIESAIKSIKQMQIIQEINAELKESRENLEKAYSLDGFSETYSRLHSIEKDLAFAEINGNNEALTNFEKEKAELLVKVGNILRNAHLTLQDLSPQYACKKCNDTGYVGTHRCDCYKK